MAKFEEASEDVINFFDEVRDNTTIPSWVEFKVLCNNKSKEVCKLVKSSDLVEILTEGLNFAVVINENIFNEMPDDLKKMAIDECLAGVSVNPDNDALSLEKPNFNTYTGVLEKYGHQQIVVLHESIKTLFVAQKQKEDEQKALTGKGKRGRKPKQ